MAQEYTSRHCKNCGRDVRASRAGTNHVLHLLLSVFSMGLWLPIWLLSMVKFGGWQCTVCGKRV